MSVQQACNVSNPAILAVPAVAETDPSTWPEWTDEGWTLVEPDDEPTAEDWADYRDMQGECEARDHLDHSERLTLVELILRQSEFFFSWNNPAGSLLADAMNGLAMRVSLVNATTPEEYWARIGVEDDAARAALIAEGYDRAMAECGERAACLGHFGHPA